MSYVLYACDGCKQRREFRDLFVPVATLTRGLYCGGCKQEFEHISGVKFRPALWWLAA